MKIRIAANPPRHVRLTIEYCLWGLGVVALGYYAFVLIQTRHYQAEQARRFDRAVAREKDTKAPNLPGDNSAPLKTNQYPINGSVVGRIQIARLGMAAMLVNGVDDNDLQRAVGHIPGTPLPGDSGNVALAGHRDTFFRPLRNIRVADQIEVTTLSGTYRYRVASTTVVDPEDVWVLKPTPDESLTLVTCYPFDFIGAAPKRFIVQAKRVIG